MRIISFIDQSEIIKKILKHLNMWEVKQRPPPRAKALHPNIQIDYTDSHIPSCEDDLYCDPDYPIQLLRNISAASPAKSPVAEPSPDVCAFIRGILAQTMIENDSQQVLPEKGSGYARKKGALKRKAAAHVPKRETKPGPTPIESGRS